MNFITGYLNISLSEAILIGLLIFALTACAIYYAVLYLFSYRACNKIIYCNAKELDPIVLHPTDSLNIRITENTKNYANGVENIRELSERYFIYNEDKKY